MTNLEELIKDADTLCQRLELESDNEKSYCYDMQIELERYTLQLVRMTNDIRQLKEIFGG